MVALANEVGWWAVALAAIGAVAYRTWRVSRRSGAGGSGEFVGVEEVRQMLLRGEAVQLVDVRSEHAFNSSATTAAGAVRLHPARAVEDARKLELPVGAVIVAFCA
jgi:hypothetical protein